MESAATIGQSSGRDSGAARHRTPLHPLGPELPLCTPNLKHFGRERGKTPPDSGLAPPKAGSHLLAGHTQRDAVTRGGAASLTLNVAPLPGGNTPRPPTAPSPRKLLPFPPGNHKRHRTLPVAPWQCRGGHWWFWVCFFFKHFHIRDFSGFWPLSVPDGQQARPSWSSSRVETATAVAPLHAVPWGH